MQRKDYKIVDNPRIQTFGLLGDKEEKIFIKELDDNIKLYISIC